MPLIREQTFPSVLATRIAAKLRVEDKVFNRLPMASRRTENSSRLSKHRPFQFKCAFSHATVLPYWRQVHHPRTLMPHLHVTEMWLRVVNQVRVAVWTFPSAPQGLVGVLIEPDLGFRFLVNMGANRSRDFAVCPDPNSL